MVGQKDRVSGGLRELLDAGSDVDGVADQRELQLASAADGARRGSYQPLTEAATAGAACALPSILAEFRAFCP